MTPPSSFRAALLMIPFAIAYAATGARAATVTATASAKIVKPLEFAGRQGLSFGQIIMVNVTAPTIVSVSQAGVLSCGAGLTCSGAVTPAIYNVRGTNGQIVRIIARASNLTNAADGRTIAFTPDAPASITLTNSGAPGRDFNVGGRISISPTTSDGVYSGAIDVTVDYN